ncbi:hypothetical protein C8J56DRAFT_897240 [Mycena floridula]|nr:hypothetical protein C8J56DRAFT_897240 [Mycena floridula]
MIDLKRLSVGNFSVVTHTPLRRIKMTPDEVALLKHIGQTNVENFAAVVAMSISYGCFYTLMLSLVFYDLLIKRNKTRVTWVLCTMLAFIFLMITVYVCLSIATPLKLEIGVFVENPELELSQRVEIADDNIAQMKLAELWFGGNGNSLVFMFAPLDSGNEIDGKIAALLTAGPVMSIVTNGIAVILIGIKAYQHRTFMKATIGQGKSAAGKVLIFLTESGIVYIIFQIINTYLLSVDSKPNSTLDYVQLIWAVEMNIVCDQCSKHPQGIYPLLVILIVNHRHSIAHITEASRPGDGNPGTHISFAHSSPLQHTTESTESQLDAAVQGSGERDTEKVSKP